METYATYIEEITEEAEKAAEYFRKGHEIRIYPFGSFAKVGPAKSEEDISRLDGSALFAVLKLDKKGDEST